MFTCINCDKEVDDNAKAIVLADGRLKVCPKCEAQARADIERLDGVPMGLYPVKYREPSRRF